MNIESDEKTSIFSKTDNDRHSDDTSWALPGTGGCLVITMVIIVINAPVYYLWYKQNGYKVKKWLKRKKDKFCVVSIINLGSKSGGNCCT